MMRGTMWEGIYNFMSLRIKELCALIPVEKKYDSLWFSTEKIHQIPH